MGLFLFLHRGIPCRSNTEFRAIFIAPQIITIIRFSFTDAFNEKQKKS